MLSNTYNISSRCVNGDTIQQWKINTEV